LKGTGSCRVLARDRTFTDTVFGWAIKSVSGKALPRASSGSCRISGNPGSWTFVFSGSPRLLSNLVPEMENEAFQITPAFTGNTG